MKSILSKIVFAFIVVGVVYALFKFNVISNPFVSKPVVIDDTPVLVKEVKNIAELFSVCFYDEVIVTAHKMEESTTDKTTNVVGSIIGKKAKDSTQRELVLIVKGRTYAGVDLASLNDNSFTKKDSSISIKIPQPKIIDVVVNPSDVTVFSETGSWTNDEVANLKIKAKDMIREKAVKNGIIEKSKKKSVFTLESLFTLIGKKKVTVDFL